MIMTFRVQKIEFSVDSIKKMVCDDNHLAKLEDKHIDLICDIYSNTSIDNEEMGGLFLAYIRSLDLYWVDKKEFIQRPEIKS